MASNPEEKRSDKTRASLIDAGIALFGEHGFSATTTRMLADMASANIAAIPYHFGSKEGLYHATIVHIAEKASALSATSRAAMEHGMGANPSPEQAIRLLEDMMSSMAMVMIGEAEPRHWVQLIMREQAKPTKSFDVLYDKMMQPMQHVFFQAMHVATGLAADSEEVKMRSHALFGQLLVFLVSRETILRNLGVRELNQKHISQIQEMLRLHVRACMQHSIGGGA